MKTLICGVCFARRSGDMYELGADIGKYYSVNVPLREGIDDHGKLCQSCIRYSFYVHHHYADLFLDLLMLLFFYSETTLYSSQYCF